MASRTNTERIDQLAQDVATLSERIYTARGDLAESKALHAALKQQVATLETRLSILEDRLKESKSASDETSRRLWTFIVAFFGAIVGAVLTFLGNLAVAHLRK